MILRFCSGSVDALELGQEALLGVRADHLDPHVAGEGAHDLVALAEAQQAVVHEDAGELVADGPVQQGGDHGGVDAAGQAEQDLVVADLAADLRDGVLDDVVRESRGCRSRRYRERSAR